MQRCMGVNGQCVQPLSLPAICMHLWVFRQWCICIHGLASSFARFARFSYCRRGFARSAMCAAFVFACYTYAFVSVLSMVYAFMVLLL